jgi:negative regulator of flagellin synthesis FlgM
MESIMKIGHLDHNPAPSPSVSERKAAPDAGCASAAHEPSAKVELSAAATLLSTAGGAGDFDTEKVARIAQAIREGKFVVDAEAIADKLISHSADLMGPARQ